MFKLDGRCSSAAQAPESSKYVRGEILHGVFLIKASKDKKHSEFTMVSNARLTLQN